MPHSTLHQCYTPYMAVCHHVHHSVTFTAGANLFHLWSWLAMPLGRLLPQRTALVGRTNGCRGELKRSTCPLTIVQHLLLLRWPLIITCTTLSTPRQVHTAPTCVSRLALPLVHLLHQGRRLHGRRGQCECPIYLPNTGQHLPLPIWPLIVTCDNLGPLRKFAPHPLVCADQHCYGRPLAPARGSGYDDFGLREYSTRRFNTGHHVKLPS